MNRPQRRGNEAEATSRRTWQRCSAITPWYVVSEFARAYDAAENVRLTLRMESRMQVKTRLKSGAGRVWSG